MTENQFNSITSLIMVVLLSVHAVIFAILKPDSFGGTVMTVLSLLSIILAAYHRDKQKYDEKGKPL